MIYIVGYAIMKTMRPLDYHHNDFKTWSTEYAKPCKDVLV